MNILFLADNTQHAIDIIERIRKIYSYINKKYYRYITDYIGYEPTVVGWANSNVRKIEVNMLKEKYKDILTKDILDKIK